MTTANTTATTLSSLVGHREPECGTPRNWALALAVVALLGLAILGLLGAELGTGIQSAAEAARDGASAVLGDLDAMVAGIRWVR